jgi:uncharacterized LabA/DUF88 family protein
MISDELRRQADNFIDLAALRGEIGRELADRPQRRNPPADQTGDDDY